MGDTDLCPYDSGTYGSMSTRFFGPAVRAAAAEAKAILLELASEQLRIPKEKLTVENGMVFATADKKARVTFGPAGQGAEDNTKSWRARRSPNPCPSSGHGKTGEADRCGGKSDRPGSICG